MCEQMTILRAGLDERGIPWFDMSQMEFQNANCLMERTRFIVHDHTWSVIHGHGSYGGFDLFHADAGLLEVMTQCFNGGDPVGWLTAEQVLKMVDEVQREAD